ncbi:hypothetical protein BH10PSE12_BH10PSE12_02840 [soil metagenome]
MGRLTNMRPMVGAMPTRVKLAPKIAESFYSSPEWRALKAAMRRQAYWCARCGSKDRLILDHIVERKDGGADLDPGNVEWLCFGHHQAKTAEARKRRARG